jgi:hypothetical protein
MTAMTQTPAVRGPEALRTWLLWIVGFVTFPIAGVAGAAASGPVDGPVEALLAGLVTGAVIGAGQALVSARRLKPVRWIVASAVGMSVGLTLGGMVVDFGTSLADLALMGGLTGLMLGLAQTSALPRRTRQRWLWAAGVTLLWALGWTVTTLVGVEVASQFSVFGASGAVTFSALSGLLLQLLLPPVPSARFAAADTQQGES